jgi:hypothetical protein
MKDDSCSERHPSKAYILELLAQIESYDTSGESALEWSFKSAVNRVTNYDREHVQLCVKEMRDKQLDKLNTSLYQSTFSQPDDDGWEDFGVPLVVDESQLVDMAFSKKAVDIVVDDGGKRETRKAEVIKQFFGIMNSIDLRNDVSFEYMKRSLIQMQKDCRMLNEIGMQRIPDDGRSYFPNSSFGDNCPDSMTKRKK